MEPRGATRESGASLLVVLTLLSVLGIVTALVFNQAREGIRSWAREAAEMQALYLAESGVAHQLYLEKFADSAEPTFKPAKPSELSEPLGFTDLFPGKDPAADTFRFHFDRTLESPEVAVDRTRAYLTIRSAGTVRDVRAQVVMRFGKALDDSIFGPALTLENDLPLEPFGKDQIRGALRLRNPAGASGSLAWPPAFTPANYVAEFVNKKYYALESALNDQLSREGGESGNGDFEPDRPPDFSKDTVIFFPLGGASLRNDGERTWVLNGPGRIYAEGDIRVKGRIELNGIQLLSSSDIVFEDSITGEDVSLYARKSVIINDRCHIGLEVVAGKHIVLRGTSQTKPGSMLLSVGNVNAGKPGDSLSTVRLQNQAIFRGFLIADGPQGTALLESPASLVEGIVIAKTAGLNGRVHGSVLARRLTCEGTKARNCLGPGRIDRSRLPPDFAQPLLLGQQDRRKFEFKLLDWERL